MCAALYMKHVGFRSGPCVFCTSPNISGITLALMSRFVGVPTFCSGTIARISKGCSEMVGQIFCVFSLESKLLTFYSMFKTRKVSKRSLWKTSVFRNTPFPAPSPQAVTGLSKTLCTQILKCNGSGQQRKPELSTLRQCPAAWVFCLTKHCRKLFFNSVTSPQNKIQLCFIYTHDMKEWLTTLDAWCLLVF